MNPPSNADEARALAADYVRAMLAKGYGPADAKREIFSGMSGPGQPGWEIKHGKISVPMCPPRWTFDFAELAAGEPVQMSLF